MGTLALTMKKGLVLVDPTTSDISVTKVAKDGQTSNIQIAQVPRRIGIENFCDLPTFTAFCTSGGSCLGERSPNLREDVLHLLEVPPPGWEAGKPSVLALAYYPLRAATAEWVLYGLLMGRYVKYYESAFNKVQRRMSDFEQVVVLDLHRWRRRSKQSIHKLQMTRVFVEHWRGKEQTWDYLIRDLKHLETLIEDHSHSLDALNPIIMALVQLQDMRRSISQAEDIKRLTYIALIFIPLSYTASVFSMAEQYGPGSEGFWIYWASSLPVAVAVVAFSFAVGKFPELVALITGFFKGRR